MDELRLKKQMEFMLELDKMKNIYRQTLVLHEDRAENDAEHSWHLAIMAFLLAEYSNEKIGVLKTIKMVLLHDVVEIDAGDTYCYDVKGNESKAERETKAAERIFGLLPDDQKEEFHSLWREFEDAETPESKFANALDRVQPLMLNYKKGGVSWKEHGIHYGQVYDRTKKIQPGSGVLWDYIHAVIDECRKAGILPD